MSQAYIPSHHCPVKDTELKRQFHGIFSMCKKKLRETRSFSCPSTLGIQDQILWFRSVRAIKRGHDKDIELYYELNKELNSKDSKPSPTWAV